VSLLRLDVMHMDQYSLQDNVIPGNRPRCLSDLLGFIYTSFAFSTPSKHPKVHPWRMSTELREQFLLPPPYVDSKSSSNERKQRIRYSCEIVDNYTALGTYDWQRYGGVSIQEGTRQELERCAVPSFMATEGFLIRCVLDLAYLFIYFNT